jgi:hypothetical protein
VRVVYPFLSAVEDMLATWIQSTDITAATGLDSLAAWREVALYKDWLWVALHQASIHTHMSNGDLDISEAVNRWRQTDKLVQAFASSLPPPSELVAGDSLPSVLASLQHLQAAN